VYRKAGGRRMKILRRIWNWITYDEGMTWERYHRNMENNRRDRK
tara:strand:- start:279 stop:410 length:132 start_codon:yes stop_codon:yes gene_type:complete